jgi:putative ABC transport system ATP-binding protein
MAQEVPPYASPRTLGGYAWRVLGPREFVINVLINTPIAYLVFHNAVRVPLVGWLSLLVVCGPMSFILPTLTTFFGYLNGVLARSRRLAGEPWPLQTRWVSKAWTRGLLTAAVIGPACLIGFAALDRLLPEVTFSKWGAIVLVGLYGGTLGYVLHARAAILAGRLGGPPQPVRPGLAAGESVERTMSSEGRPRMPILEARQVSKVYGSAEPRVEALWHVDLTVAAGELVAIVGPSGSGKSTLLHILGGLDFPTAGHVLIEGADLSELDDDRRTIFRRQRIGFVFQRFNLLPNLTAIQNVALPLMLDRVSFRERTRRAREILALVGLSQRENSHPKTLSGGEQQRVAIARALVTLPALILADEPTGMLDSGNARHIIGLLRTLVAERSQTVVIVTHDSDVASQADRRIQVLDGRVSEMAVAGR